MTSDIFTKNSDKKIFEKNIKTFVGSDEYMSGINGKNMKFTLMTIAHNF